MKVCKVPPKTFFAIKMAALLLASSPVMAESNSTTSPAAPAAPISLENTVIYSQTPEARDYVYGMRLDIAEVVDMEYFPPEPNFCGVIPAQMTYENSMGEINSIRYLYMETEGCGEN